MDAKQKELNRAYDRLAYWAGRVRVLQFGDRGTKPKPKNPAAPKPEARP